MPTKDDVVLNEALEEQNKEDYSDVYLHQQRNNIRE